MMNISAFFIRNPIPGILLFILLSIAGIFGFSNMTVKLFPDIDVPIIVVTVPVPGGAPEQLENDVARKVEDKLASLTGLKHLFTTLVDNAVTTIVEFRIEKPVQEAVDEVRSAVNEVRGDLPASAESPIVTKMNINEQPLFIFSITSSQLDATDLSWYVDSVLTKRLLGIQGVGHIKRIGGVEREIQILVDPTALLNHQTTVVDISQQIRLMQQDFSGGEARLGGLTQPIRTQAAVKDINDLKGLSLTSPTGALIKLSDIASVKDTFKKQTSKALLNGQEGVAFIVQRSKNYGDLDVGKAVKAALATLRQANPHLTITEVFETMSMVQEDYQGAMTMLAEGAALAVFVVLLFLGGAKPTLFFALALGIAYYLINRFDTNWAFYLASSLVILPVIVFFDRFRTTLVAATALPLSILPAFAGMYFLGLSINLMVTLALSLVVGILVDDAIVEVENIDRHMNQGKPPFNAALDATNEIGIAVIAITTTLIAVFLPTAFMPGIPGKFFYQFGLAASLAIFSSLLVARIITPIMAAYFMKPFKASHQEPFWMATYLWLASWAIKLRWLTLLLASGFFITSLAVLKDLPSDFIPPSDGSFTLVNIELPPNATLEQTQAIAETARQKIKTIPSIAKVFTYIGGREVRKATLYLTFTPRQTRPLKRTIENQVRSQLQQVAGARFSVMSGANGEKYEMILSGSNPAELSTTTQNIIKELQTIDGLGNLSNSSGLRRQELRISPDYTKSAERGVSSAAIAQAIRIATVGDFEGQLAKFNSDQRQIPIVVKLTDTAKSDIDTLKNLLVIGKKGPVRLGDVAEIALDSGPLEIKRYDRERYVKLEIEIIKGELGSIQDKINQLPTIKNLPASVKQVTTGDAEIMKELGISFAIAMLVAILCIYFVLILLFGQITQPITILVALPLSIGGAVGGLILVKAGMSLPAMIGFLMLMGIAVKNSILLVEYVISNRKRQASLTRLEALLDACHKRARPIIMTTIAMGAGMLPLIVGLGDIDYSFRRPMAAAVLGGLITSTVLSLIVIPAFYTIVEDTSTLVKSLVYHLSQQSGKNQ